MNPKPPIILDFFISRERTGDLVWLLIVPYDTWVPGVLQSRMNGQREVPNVNRPDLDELDQLMFRLDAPYLCRVTNCGTWVQLLAEGRSAMALAKWLEGYLSQPMLSSGEPLPRLVKSAPGASRALLERWEIGPVVAKSDSA